MLGAWNKDKGDQYGRNVKNLNDIFLYTQCAQALKAPLDGKRRKVTF
jgi:hypothetical protein